MLKCCSRPFRHRMMNSCGTSTVQSRLTNELQAWKRPQRWRLLLLSFPTLTHTFFFHWLSPSLPKYIFKFFFFKFFFTDRMNPFMDCQRANWSCARSSHSPLVNDRDPLSWHKPVCVTSCVTQETFTIKPKSEVSFNDGLLELTVSSWALLVCTAALSTAPGTGRESN